MADNTDNMSGPDNQDPAQVSDPGAMLRTAREARGLTLEQAANELHVNTSIITSLEHNDYSNLAVPTFVKGHLRNYARLLELDATVLIMAYEAMEHPRIPELVAFRTGPHRSATIAGWVGLIGVVLVGVLLLLTGLWWTHRSEAMRDIQNVSTAAQPGNATRQKDTLPANKDSGGNANDETPQPAMQENVSKTEEGNASSQNTVTSPVLPKAAESESQPASAIPDSDGKSRITLDVAQASWVEVSDGANTTLYYDLAPAGKELRLDGVAPFKIFLGNSPGVHITVNGQPFDQSAYNRSDHTARFVITVADKTNAAGD